MVICWDFYCPKNGSLSKNKKGNILQELANKNSIKCLSHCYCGMSMGFRVVGEVVMTGGGYQQLDDTNARESSS